MGGSVEQFTNVDVGKGKIATKWSMTEPAFSFFAIFYEGIEQNLDMPHLGGMNKVKYVSTSDGFEQTLESEKFGKTHGIEKYSDEGVTMTWTYKGKSHTEFWKRIINEDGFYRIKSNENLEAYLKDDGMPDDFIATLVNEMTMQWKFTDSGYEMTEWFGGGLKVKTCGNFDEEVDYVFPVEGAEPMKYVTTKIGNGKYKAFIKQENGQPLLWKTLKVSCWQLAYLKIWLSNLAKTVELLSGKTVALFKDGIGSVTLHLWMPCSSWKKNLNTSTLSCMTRPKFLSPNLETSTR